MDKQSLQNMIRSISSDIEQAKILADRLLVCGDISEADASDLKSQIRKCYESAVLMEHQAAEQAVVNKLPSEEAAAVVHAQLRDPSPAPKHTQEEIKPSRKEIPMPSKQINDNAEVSPSIYDKIAVDQPDRSLASRLQQTPVNDLAKAIGINQRFTFIQELFGNDPKAFAESVKHLNSLPNFDTAEEFILKTLVPQFGWDIHDDKVAADFYNLVRRRYNS